MVASKHNITMFAGSTVCSNFLSDFARNLYEVKEKIAVAIDICVVQAPPSLQTHLKLWKLNTSTLRNNELVFYAPHMW